MGAAVAAYGAVDSVFVASGLNKPAPIEEMRYEDWQEVMDANVRGPWLMAKAFGRHLASREADGSPARGKLLLVSSVRGRHGSPAGYSAYCTSKAAVLMMGKSLARDPRATMVVNLQEPPYGFVQVQGDAELSEDPAELLRTAIAIASNGLSSSSAAR